MNTGVLLKGQLLCEVMTAWLSLLVQMFNFKNLSSTISQSGFLKKALAMIYHQLNVKCTVVSAQHIMFVSPDTLAFLSMLGLIDIFKYVVSTKMPGSATTPMTLNKTKQVNE